MKITLHFAAWLFLLSVLPVAGQIVAASSDASANAAATDSARPLTLAETIELALKQASAVKSANLDEQIAAEDVKQAKAAFYPKIAASPNVIYTTPSLGKSFSAVATESGVAAARTRPPSFLGANAVSEFQAVVNASGELDLSGKLKAALKRSEALLDAARIGGEIAKRELVAGVEDAYFGLALATLKRRGAESSLAAARDFEKYEKLQLGAGEIAPVDVVRARLQTAQRADELEQALAAEEIAAGGLKLLVGYDFAAPIAAEDLLVRVPVDGEIETVAATAVATRPELAIFDAERRAAESELEIAKKERRPQLNYSVSSGFIADSLFPRPVYNSLGVQAQVGVTIPLFDGGASRSREAQARLRIGQTENNRQITERQLAAAFFAARTQAVAARARIRELAASLTDAELNVAASLSRYRAGEASITEVTDANNTLVALRQTLYQAIFDYQTARSRLLRAAGK